MAPAVACQKFAMRGHIVSQPSTSSPPVLAVMCHSPACSHGANRMPCRPLSVRGTTPCRFRCRKGIETDRKNVAQMEPTKTASSTTRALSWSTNEPAARDGANETPGCDMSDSPKISAQPHLVKDDRGTRRKAYG